MTDRVNELNWVPTLVYMLSDSVEGLTLGEMATELGVNRCNAERMRNVDTLDLAIAAGTRRCDGLLEPLQKTVGRIVTRSAYCSRAVDQLGNEMQVARRSAYSWEPAASSHASHTWDRRELAAAPANR